MLNIKVTNCRDCAQASKLIDSIDCQLAKMANNLYMNISYMLDKPVEACNMSALLHYKRILTFKSCNADWASDYSVDDIASRINFLTVGCKCCDQSSSGELTTTTTTTSTSSTTTTTTTTVAPLTLFFVALDDGCPPNPVINIGAYHNGVGALPTNGNQVWQDSGGTIALADTFYSAAVNTGGTVIGQFGQVVGGIWNNENASCE